MGPEASADEWVRRCVDHVLLALAHVRESGEWRNVVTRVIPIPDSQRGRRELVADRVPRLVPAVSTQPESGSVSGLVAFADGFAVEWQLPQPAMLP